MGEFTPAAPGEDRFGPKRWTGGGTPRRYSFTLQDLCQAASVSRSTLGRDRKNGVVDLEDISSVTRYVLDKNGLVHTKELVLWIMDEIRRDKELADAI